VAILSGRADGDVARRACELAIDSVRTGVSDKLVGYRDILRAEQVSDAAVAYMGDDLPDLPPLTQCGLPIAVANAVPAVKRAAMYVTRRSGGAGAVAETVEWILRKQGQWPTAV
jgi:3-deoxy-D-manno-octulosonate 8-phosphate phosphatase (KDO 8-P phosphatase)